MQAPGLTQLCRRSFLILMMMALAAGTLSAQANSGSQDSLEGTAAPGTPPIAAPPAASATVPAAGTSTPAEAAVSSAAEESSALLPSTGWSELLLSIFRALGGIGLVACMILAGYMLFRKFAPQYAVKRTADRKLRLIETLSMGDKRNIALVQVGNKKLLLASTPGQVTLLTTFTDAAGNGAPVAAIAGKPPAAAAAPGNFKNMFELQKKAAPALTQVRQALPPDIRGKMLELRKALEG